MIRWDQLTRAQQTQAREIRDWAAARGAAVSVSQIARDLDMWEDAHAAGRLPAGTPLAAPPYEPGATTPLGREAARAAYHIIRQAAGNALWPLGERVWRGNPDGTRVWAVGPDGIRWMYIGAGEFRLSTTCRHCAGRFGVAGIVDATTYHLREQALRRRHGVCPDCTPRLRDCTRCGDRMLPDPARGTLCRKCHTHAETEAAHAANQAAFEAGLDS